MSASTSPAEARPAERFPLDGLRAIAALLVVAFHAYQNNMALPGGFEWEGLGDSILRSAELAVDLFFVISGFVLWLPIAKAGLAGAPQRSARDLLRRRVVRLVPLYFAVFLVLWAIANPALGQGWTDLLLHLTFTQIYSDQYIFYTLGPAWSLAVEFHFYALIALAVPVVGFLSTRWLSRAARVVAVAALPVVLVLVGIGYLYWATRIDPQPLDHWSVWFSVPSKAADFGFGMLAAVLVNLGWRAGPWARGIMAVTASAIIAAGVWFRPLIAELDRQWLHIVFAFVALLIVMILVSGRTSASPGRFARAIAYIGVISYSTYLVHEAVMHLIRNAGLLPATGSTIGVVVTTILVYVGSLLLSVITYNLIELPAQRFMGFYDSTGKRREYYAHLEQPIIAAQNPVESPAPTDAGPRAH